MKRPHNARALMSEVKFFEGYARFLDAENRYETWDEAVARVMEMHREFYRDKLTPALDAMIQDAEDDYTAQRVLGAQRALQYGGEQLIKHQMRNYNCTSSYADRPRFFSEMFYVLLCGSGVGFSVQPCHVDKLPDIAERKKQAKVWAVEDSIEGWADALGALLSSYFVEGGQFPTMEGRRVYFDLNSVRPKGSMISGGFKAPGPEPLRRALDRIEHLLQAKVLKGHTRLRPIDVYDIAMHAADAVLAGGVRRSATICLFDPDDDEMVRAKTGNWFEENPQRARSNNSAVIVRDYITREKFAEIMKSIREFGEPGFFFVDNRSFTTNPCCEISMLPIIDGESGWQTCNLTEINGGLAHTDHAFYQACRSASILGTLQAGYTDFKYLEETTRRIVEREALLGVSITGFMNNPEVLLDSCTLRTGARIVRETNEEVAALIGINPAARTTCVKPSGNASVLLQTASGIHPEHSPRYLRNMQISKESEVAQALLDANPYAVEESIWSAGGTDFCISFPVVAPTGSTCKKDITGTNLLGHVKLVQNSWVEAGTNVERCVDRTLRHNVSNTITVNWDEWEAVEQYVFENRSSFAGISFLAGTGDKDYYQAPFTEVLDEKAIVRKYGVAALFASALCLESHRSGFGSLWEAVKDAGNGAGIKGGAEVMDQRREWIRKFRKFAATYFDNNLAEAGNCLKDVHLLHRWEKIQQNFVPVYFEESLGVKKYVDASTMAAEGCAGGACEI